MVDLLKRRRRVLLLAVAGSALLSAGFLLARAGSSPAAYDLPGYGHELGAADARVVIVEFVDFSCPACGRFFREKLGRLEQEWVSSGRARLRVIPFNALGSGWTAARAAECAAEQDAFWPMHDRLFTRQSEWLGRLGRRGQYQRFTEWAAELQLDTATFRTCWKAKRWLEQVKRNTALARSNGVPGTPAFVVNGRALVGDLPYDEFVRALEAALSGVNTETRSANPGERRN
jgi:protein-disulfide isomerase